MKEKKIPTRTCRLWQLRFALLAFLILCIIGLVNRLSELLFLFFYIVPALFFVLIFGYLPLFFKSYSIYFSGEAIIVKLGVFIKTTHIMPFSRLVFVQSFSTPLAKQMKLSAFTLKAARSRVIVPELEQEEVDSIISILTQEAEK